MRSVAASHPHASLSGALWRVPPTEATRRAPDEGGACCRGSSPEERLPRVSLRSDLSRPRSQRLP
eukprot:scaffold47_cov258-Pinguiococcus_pyrenoidosus.AAC.4